MLRHLVILIRILWWGYILEAFYGDRWWQIWWGKYAPYIRLQWRKLPWCFSAYYSMYWYHTSLVKNRFFSIYLHGGFCHIEIELYFTPMWRTMQFFIKGRAYKGLNAYRLPNEPIKKTTMGQFFNTFVNRQYDNSPNDCPPNVANCDECDFVMSCDVNNGRSY